jgi:hypothetical protein
MGSSTALKFCIWGFEDSTPATHHRSMQGQYRLEARASDCTALILDNSLPVCTRVSPSDCIRGADSFSITVRWIPAAGMEARRCDVFSSVW